MTDLDQRLRDHLRATAMELPAPPLDQEAPARRARRRRQNRLATAAVGVVVVLAGLGIAVGFAAGGDEGTTRTVDGPTTTVAVTSTTTTARPEPPPPSTPADTAAPPRIVAGAEALGDLRPPAGGSAVIDANALVTRVDVGADQLAWVVAGAGSVWVMPLEQPDALTTVVRVDPATDEVIARINLPTLGESQYGSRLAPFATADAVWAPTSSGWVYRIDPSTNTVVASVSLEEPLDWMGPQHDHWHFGATLGSDALWVWPLGEHRWQFGARRWLLDLETSVLAETTEAAEPDMQPAEDGWVASEGRLERIDAATNTVVTSFDLSAAEGSGYSINRTIYDVVVGDEAVWVAMNGSVVRVDPRTGQVVATLPLLTANASIEAVVVGDELFVVSGQTLFHIDTAGNVVEAAYGITGLSNFVGNSGDNLAAAGDHLWLRTDQGLARVALTDLLGSATP